MGYVGNVHDWLIFMCNFIISGYSYSYRIKLPKNKGNFESLNWKHHFSVCFSYSYIQISMHRICVEIEGQKRQFFEPIFSAEFDEMVSQMFLTKDEIKTIRKYLFYYDRKWIKKASHVGCKFQSLMIALSLLDPFFVESHCVHIQSNRIFHVKFAKMYW